MRLDRRRKGPEDQKHCLASPLGRFSDRADFAGLSISTVPPTGFCRHIMSLQSPAAATTTAVATEQKREQPPRAGVQGHRTTDR